MVPTPMMCSPVWRGFWCVTSHVTRTKAGCGAFIGVLSPSASSVSQVKKRNVVLRPQGCPCPRALALGALFSCFLCLSAYQPTLATLITPQTAPKSLLRLCPKASGRLVYCLLIHLGSVCNTPSIAAFSISTGLGAWYPAAWPQLVEIWNTTVD